MSQKRTQKLAFAALFGALTFAATWISFPSPFGGNVNFGDCILLISAWLPLEPWSIFAVAIGATFTDLSAGYAIYAPATFVIKALMVLVAILIKRGLSKIPTIWCALLSGVAAELVMTVGYFAYETILYGAASALLNIPFNLAQGGIAITAAIVLSFVLSRMPLPEILRSQWTLFGKGFTKKQ
ncbi:MAG: ECF transporter S component [Ruminococcaceae bacterium]|nr:ECF transporter S component [Oscillospiraceae bacterium]